MGCSAVRNTSENTVHTLQDAIKLNVATLRDLMRAGSLVMSGKFEMSIEDIVAFVEVRVVVPAPLFEFLAPSRRVDPVTVSMWVCSLTVADVRSFVTEEV